MGLKEGKQQNVDVSANDNHSFVNLVFKKTSLCIVMLPSRRRKCVIYGETNNHAVVFAHVVCPNAHQGRLFAPKAPTRELSKLCSFQRPH